MGRGNPENPAGKQFLQWLVPHIEDPKQTTNETGRPPSVCRLMGPFFFV